MEAEADWCECCSFTEESTPEYITAVSAEYMGRWSCVLCVEAVGNKVRGAGSGAERNIIAAEALDRHGKFAWEAPRAPGKATEVLATAVPRLLRRCLDSPPP
ncbi:hypothetical protein ACQ4PT_023588 [Festuca glaucescens]